MKKNEPVMVCLVSLGCPKNFVDTEVAAGSMLCGGIGITPDEDSADVMLVNTCAFIESARKESADAVKRAVRWKKQRKDRKLIVAGCMVEWNGFRDFQKKYPEVDLWTRIDSIENMGKIVTVLCSGGEVPAVSQGEPRYLYNENTPRLQLTPGHYAYLKIADGCDNRCAYCSIPLIRGGLRSRTEKSVVEEAKALIGGGVRELIVIAQDIGAFRMDAGEKDALAGLVKKLDSLKGDFRIRLMYLHPARVTEKLCRVLADAKHLIRCIEMPLQHISDHVLKEMGRKVGEAETRAAVQMIRQTAKCSVRTTFLTGFPGETEEDFETLRRFVEEQKFARMGVFPYSPEAGTPAAVMKNQVPRKKAESRANRLMELQSRISQEANAALIGTEVKFIVDSEPFRGKCNARTFEDAPEIDNGAVLRKCPKELRPGATALAKVVSASEYDITADFIKEV